MSVSEAYARLAALEQRVEWLLEQIRQIKILVTTLNENERGRRGL